MLHVIFFLPPGRWIQPLTGCLKLKSVLALLGGNQVPHAMRTHPTSLAKGPFSKFSTLDEVTPSTQRHFAMKVNSSREAGGEAVETETLEMAELVKSPCVNLLGSSLNHPWIAVEMQIYLCE